MRVAVSRSNIDELVAGAPRLGCDRIRELLSFIKSMAKPLFLREPPDYFNEMGRYVLRARRTRPSIYYEKRTPLNDVRQLIDAIIELENQDMLIAAQQVKQSSRAGNKALRDLRSLVKRDPASDVAPGSFSDWVNSIEFEHVETALASISRRLTKRRDRRRLWRMSDPSIRVVIEVMLFPVWSRARGRGPKANIGRNDAQQLLYAPHVDGFVTNDSGLLVFGRHSGRKAIMDYATFQDRLTAWSASSGHN